jgi:hypothetical protein
MGIATTGDTKESVFSKSAEEEISSIVTLPPTGSVRSAPDISALYGAAMKTRVMK